MVGRTARWGKTYYSLVPSFEASREARFDELIVGGSTAVFVLPTSQRLCCKFCCRGIDDVGLGVVTRHFFWDRSWSGNRRAPRHYEA